jgi:Tol biopolymer transport system component
MTTKRRIATRARLAALVLVGSLAVLAGRGQVTDLRAESPPLLIFASDQAADYYPEVYSFDLASGVRHDVSMDEHSDQLAALRGRQVLFESDRAAPALYTEQLGSSAAPRKLATLPAGMQFGSATWSPSGAELAVSLQGPQGGLIELLDRTGRELARIHGVAGGPVWSDDGESLAFTASGRPKPVIKLVDARGRVRWTRPGDYTLAAASAPRFAIVSETTKGGVLTGSTVVVDEAGRVLRRVAGIGRALSPDGGTLLLASGSQTLWLASVDSGRLQRLPSSNYQMGAFSPDSRHLELLLSTASGDKAVIVSPSSGRIEAHLPAWGQWLPDSRRLAIVTGFQSVVTLASDQGRVLRHIQLGPPGESVGLMDFTQDSGTIVTTAQGLDIHNLYEQLPSGALQQLTNVGQGVPNLVDHTQPAPSPDGKLIADSEFGAPCGNCEPKQVIVFPLDGSAPNRVMDPNGTEDGHPTWSPDGTHIAYATNDANGLSITVVQADGTHPVVLPAGIGASEPSWSPDGSEIAAVKNGIFLMAPDGSDPQQLTGAVPAGSNISQTHAPSWSPDSSTLAFAGADGLYLIGRDGSDPRRILAMPGISAVSWSPDGSLIAFAACQGTASQCPSYGANHDIWTVKPDGSDLQRVTDTLADDTTPAWLPAAA